MMFIKQIDAYRDGGTIAIETDEGLFCIDNRIETTTKGTVYLGYPDRGVLVEKKQVDELYTCMLYYGVLVTIALAQLKQER